MPHVIVEHSSDMDAKPFLVRLHQLVANFESVRPEAVKTRSQMFRCHTVAGDTHTSFIHVEFRLLKGRSEALKKSFAEAIQMEAKAFGEAQGGTVAVSTHVSELDPEFYKTELLT